MKLIIDIGNSGAKFALYEGRDKVAARRMEIITWSGVKEVLKNYNPDMAIVSSVNQIPPVLLKILADNMNFYHILSQESILPFTVKYETPETLGSDRLSAVAGAVMHFPGFDALVIDAGTALTFDIIINKEYQGGAISPGIDIRFKALNTFTRKLPLIKRSGTVSYPAKTTETSINAGVISGVVFEINEYIRTFVTKYQDAKIILTGGDGAFLQDLISGDVIYMPDIVTEGLNFILDYNAK